MRKILLAIMVWLCTIGASAQEVKLNTEGREAGYVETIIKRSQKIVDGLNISDAKKAFNR